ncbi:unnamed protein product [Rhizoctonia solani]|uniref:Protein kinase domain-containing protein n=1 Tax=Rhizoctonia solani TaxID=456999 RepID=A0A8H3C799_9AGAM|nr:unnamed protein product [Rhizoctonia solani]CAE6475735.1 unnamed protein product [Rhizoctonia solani]
MRDSDSATLTALAVVSLPAVILSSRSRLVASVNRAIVLAKVNFNLVAYCGGLGTSTLAEDVLRWLAAVIHQLDTGNDLITSTMPAKDMFIQLIVHGCPDLTTMIDYSKSSSFPIAKGGYGDIYKSSLRENGQVLCVKTLRYLVGQSDGDCMHPKMAAYEAYTWWKISNLNHPNVLKLLGVAMFRSQIAMISTWMPGGTLSRYLSSQPKVDRYELCSQITNAVAYLHGEGIIHGDIRGDNILLSENRQVLKLADFGNASCVHDNWSLRFSQSNRDIIAVIRWTAPELMCNEDDSKIPAQAYSSDVYSLGMAMLETMTGEIPFFRLRYEAVCYRIANKQHPNRPQRCLPSDIKAGRMWSLLLECWNYDPGRRPNASRVHDELILVNELAGSADWEEGTLALAQIPIDATEILRESTQFTSDVLIRE